MLFDICGRKKSFIAFFLMILIALSTAIPGFADRNVEKIGSDYSSDGWSAWTSVPIFPSADIEVETRRTVSGYHMVHYGTQKDEYPHYRMFRGFSILHNLADYDARESYGEKHFTRTVTPEQLNLARTFPEGTFITGEYSGFQMDSRPAYSFGDDKYVWYVESVNEIVEYRYRNRNTVFYEIPSSNSDLYSGDGWSSWTRTPIARTYGTEVETRSTVIGYHMVHYGTQMDYPPKFYRMFRSYSISKDLASYGARESYGEKHFTRYVTPEQLNSAVAYPEGTFINGDYSGYQMGHSTAYSFGDDKYVWFIESTDEVTEYRARRTGSAVPTPVPQHSSGGIFVSNGPSITDLDSVVQENITYPLYSSYLKAYELQYVQAPGGRTVYTYYAPFEDANRRKNDLLYEGTEVTVLARENGMSCVTYQNGLHRYAAWVKSTNLAY